MRLNPIMQRKDLSWLKPSPEEGPYTPPLAKKTTLPDPMGVSGAVGQGKKKKKKIPVVGSLYIHT